MFGLISDSRLFLKDSPDLREISAGRELAPFVYERQTPTGKRKTVTLGYVAVPEDILDDPDLLGQWATAASADQ